MLLGMRNKPLARRPFLSDRAVYYPSSESLKIFHPIGYPFSYLDFIVITFRWTIRVSVFESM